MATLEQLSAALVKADAAGNAADARALADAIRTMQAQPQPDASQAAAQPPPDMYASGNVKRLTGTTSQGDYQAALRRIRETQFPNMSDKAWQEYSRATFSPYNFKDTAQQAQTFGFGDEIGAGISALGSQVKNMLGDKSSPDFGTAYGDYKKLEESRRDLGREQLGEPASIAADLLGGFSTVGPGAAAPAAVAPSLLKTAATSAATGSAMGAVYGLGSADDDRLNSALAGGVTGGVFGAAAPVLGSMIGNKVASVAQRRMTNSAIKNAPAAADLRAASSQMFKAVDNSGVTIDTNKFSQFVNDLVKKAKRDRINPNLDPKAHGAYQELIGALADVQQNGTALTISDMHTLRQIAQKAAVSAEGRDSMFASRIVDGLDDFITQPGVAKLPPNRLGSGNPTGAANDLLKAISTWGRSRRVGLIEEAVYKASNQASGVENGLRIQFRQLLQNKKTRALFNKAEIQAIEEVANGTGGRNIMRVLGSLGVDLGTGRNSLMALLSTIGATSVAGPIAGAVVGVGGAAARKATEIMARKAAERAARVVATPNIPIYQPKFQPTLPVGGFIAAEDQQRQKAVR